MSRAAASQVGLVRLFVLPLFQQGIVLEVVLVLLRLLLAHGARLLNQALARSAFPLGNLLELLLGLFLALGGDIGQLHHLVDLGQVLGHTQRADLGVVVGRDVAQLLEHRLRLKRRDALRKVWVFELQQPVQKVGAHRAAPRESA